MSGESKTSHPCKNIVDPHWNFKGEFVVLDMEVCALVYILYMHTCIHAYMHTCTHAHMHTCILVSYSFCLSRPPLHIPLFHLPLLVVRKGAVEVTIYDRVPCSDGESKVVFVGSISLSVSEVSPPLAGPILYHALIMLPPCPHARMQSVLLLMLLPLLYVYSMVWCPGILIQHRRSSSSIRVVKLSINRHHYV